MVLLTGLAVLGAVLGSVHAVPTDSAIIVHERRDAPPASWIKMERVDRRTVLPVRIGLVQSNIDKVHSLLMDVSHHESPNYGKYYTADEVTDMFAPSSTSVDAVRSWLESAGIPAKKITQSVNKQWIQFDAHVDDVEQLFRTRYHVYEHGATGRTNIACEEYHVPAAVQEHIDYVTPGLKLSKNSGLPAPHSHLRKRTFGFRKGHSSGPSIRPMPASVHTLVQTAKAANLSVCSTTIVPECIQALYNITKGDKAAPGNELGIFEDLGDVYSQADLDLFFANVYPEIPRGTGPVLDLIDGAVAPLNESQAGAESELDFQISYPIIYPQNSILYQTDDPVYENNYTFQGFLNNFFDAIDGSYCTYTAYNETGNSPLDPPYPDPAPGGYKGQLQCGVYQAANVISISYGGAESDLPISYQRRQCSEVAKLGLQGTTVVVSSGDSGVSGRNGDPTPSNCLGPDGTIFAPQFPASCPYITAVGGTYVPPNGSVAEGEVAVSRFPSGGGFSNIYNRDAEAPWQTDAVNAYFAKDLVDYPYYESVSDNSSFGENGGIYNRLGRAYPDVSAVGDNVVIYFRGEPNLIGGTSASSPTFAAILTRINEERLAVNKTTVGYVNPILYANPGAFNDITVGNNSGCGTPGFFASSGWDPVTGLGTPNYPSLLEVFLALP